MKCPWCQKTLVVDKHPNGAIWRCSNCPRSCVNMAVLRKRLEPETVGIVWRQTDMAQSSSRHCPSCSRPLKLFSGSINGRRITLDVCRLCQLVCFDNEELGALRQDIPEDTLSLEAREAIARCRIELDRHRQATVPLIESKYELAVECIWIVLYASGSLM